MTANDVYLKRVNTDHRKRYAQFFTPMPIAEHMAGYLFDGYEPKRILDPSVGLGVFIDCVRRYSDAPITAYDLDAVILSHLSVGKNVEVINLNFIQNGWPDKYDAIICNPPYLKFHDYDNKALVSLVNTKLGTKLGYLTNLYCLFVIKALSQLSIDGKAVFIVPAEFLNSNYGVAVKNYMLDSKMLKAVDVIDGENGVFGDAVTTTCILYFKNDGIDSDITFKHGGSIDRLMAVGSYKPQDLDPSVKWRGYYIGKPATAVGRLVPFSKYVKVVRGIATGDNDYFTFDKFKQTQWGLPDTDLVKCLTKSQHLDKAFFTDADFDDLYDKGKRCLLLNTVGADNPYVVHGEKLGVNTKYLTSRRNPWFSTEKRKPAPILAGVFNRGGLKFVYNATSAVNLTCFHCIYPHDPSRTELIHSYLVTQTAQDVIMENGRDYGDGLGKLEPGDLNAAMVVDFDGFPDETVVDILEIYHGYKKKVINGENATDELERLDKIYKGMVYG